MNQIVIGPNGCGKTRLFLIPKIHQFDGKVVLFEEEPLQDLFKGTNFRYQSIGLSQLELNRIVTSDAKVFICFNDYKDEKLSGGEKAKFYGKQLSKFLTQLESYSDELSLLFAFDNFIKFRFNLTQKMSNGKSVLFNLLSLNTKRHKINCAITASNFESIETDYPDEAQEIADNSLVFKLERPQLFKVDNAEDYSGDLRVRFPRTLHRQLALKAKEEKVSLNQYIIYLLAKSL